MTANSAEGPAWRPELFEDDPESRPRALQDLFGDPLTAFLDQRAAQRADLDELQVVVPPEAAEHPGCWVHYPWRRSVVAVLGPDAFRLLRLDRNRNKITAEEQQRLKGLRIGVVGLSVGHAIAHTLALEGLCGELRLADFDRVEVSNLNRIPGTVFDLNVNKAVVAARRIAELDPYLDVQIFTEGVSAENIPAFLDGLDVLVEECDSLDLKVVLREEARRRGIPVLMETSDRGLLDVERFDLEPQRPVFHGLLGGIDSSALEALSAEDKVPHVLRIVGATTLSPRMAASMVEVGRSLTTWPQLGGDVALGGATIAAAVRRLGTRRSLPSGRVRIDLDDQIDRLRTSDERDAVGTTSAIPSPRGGDEVEQRASSTAPHEESRFPQSDRSEEDGDVEEHPVVPAVLEAIRRAPSGGNVQPWSVQAGADEVRLLLDAEGTTTMDVEFRGSYVALGAALYNARAAASAAGALGPVSLFPDPTTPELVATLEFGNGAEDHLTRLFPQVARRTTNRHLGRAQPLPETTTASLRAAATHEGGRVRLVPPGDRLLVAGEAMAAADRIRLLTSRLHAEMFSELVWPDAPRDVGIETGLLGMDASDLAKLAIIARPEVTALLAEWDAGEALGDDTSERIASSSALAVVSVDGVAPADFVRGGSAVEAVWLEAEVQGLAVHPMSPVFLFAVKPSDLAVLSDRFAGRLADAQASFRRAVGLEEAESVALVLRLSHTDVKVARSRRRPIVTARTTT